MITKYDNHDRVVMTKTIYANYDNDDRYSTYDYRHGYNYRTSQNYWEKQHGNTVYLNYKKDDYSYKEKSGCNQDWKWKEYDKRLGDYYVPYLKKTGTRKCYSSPPKGKLFYVKC